MMKKVFDKTENKQYNRKQGNKNKEYKKQARQKQSNKWLHI